MTKQEFSALCAAGPVLLDGATGSNLMASGMPRGVCTEAWILEHPSVLLALQRGYVEAGSQILYAPTFTANAVYLGQHGLADQLEEINRRLVALSRQAAGQALVAGDMTTLGQPVGPEGCDSHLYEVYTRQAKALVAAGVDLMVVETMLGCGETVAALEAISAVCDLPVVCTLTIEADGRTYFGDDAVETGQTLAALGAAAVGINCSCGPSSIAPTIRRLREAVEIPIVAKPNAGMPTIGPDGQTHYDLSPQEFARQMRSLRQTGATLLGGCCGTTPAHIRALRTIL